MNRRGAVGICEHDVHNIVSEQGNGDEDPGMLIAGCGPFSWRKRRWSRFSPALAESLRPPAVSLAGTPFYLLVQAVNGA